MTQPKSRTASRMKEELKRWSGGFVRVVPRLAVLDRKRRLVSSGVVGKGADWGPLLAVFANITTRKILTLCACTDKIFDAILLLEEYLVEFPDN